MLAWKCRGRSKCRSKKCGESCTLFESAITSKNNMLQFQNQSVYNDQFYFKYHMENITFWFSSDLFSSIFLNYFFTFLCPHDRNLFNCWNLLLIPKVFETSKSMIIKRKLLGHIWSRSLLVYYYLCTIWSTIFSSQAQKGIMAALQPIRVLASTTCSVL